ncbi:MAG: hypothetical protein JNN25_09855 [Candidatus Kapabacteria bacterium]|nr:hypothetical protein [Candidatus Kapabacteria bacterium]
MTNSRAIYSYVCTSLLLASFSVSSSAESRYTVQQLHFVDGDRYRSEKLHTDTEPPVVWIDQKGKTVSKKGLSGESMLEDSVLLCYVGEYHISPTFPIRIVKDGKRLFAQALNGSKQEIIAETDSRFLLKGANVQIEFVKDKSGVVSTLFLYRNGQKMEGKRVPTLQCK